MPHEIRLKVDACGICGTDLHLRAGDETASGFGHEVAGTVLEVGASVDNVEVGRRVALDSSTPCGKCANCHNMRQELCSNLQTFGRSKSFGLGREMISPGISALPYDGLEPEVAALQEPLGVAIDMVRLADITINSNVLLMGTGTIGLMALQLARRAGARRVFAAGRRWRTARTELASRFGADEFFDPGETPVTEYDFQCDIDRVLVTSPPSSLEDAFKVASRSGIISFIGIEHDEGAFCRFNANDFHFKKLQLRASFASPAMFGPLALRYLRDGVVDGQALVSHTFALEQAQEAMDTARDDATAVKVVVKP